MKKTIVAIATGALTLSLAACGGNKESYDAICVDPGNNVRIDEDFCEEDDDDFDPSRPHSWLFFPAGRAPVMGSVASGGMTNVPGNARTNFLSTDSKTKTKPKPTTQVPKPTTQAPKVNTQKPKPQAKPAPKSPPKSGR